MAHMPEMTLVKNKTAIAAAIISLIILSADPMFFFMTLIFWLVTFTGTDDGISSAPNQNYRTENRQAVT